MRKEGLRRLLDLTLRLEGTATGLSLDEMAAAISVDRRTIQRMLPVVQAEFPQLAATEDTPGGIKRWKLPRGSQRGLSDVTADELAALSAAAQLARREGDERLASHLDRLALRLPAALEPKQKRQIEPDLEALLLASGVAHRPGPREIIAEHVLTALRDAIVAGVWVDADHRARASGKLSRNVELGPLALLLGEGRQYLVAWSDYQEDVRLFALAGFERVDLLDEPFERPEGFDLQSYLSRSFGIFQEDVHDVAWRFPTEVAAEAERYLFHPTQQSERQGDGSLLVRFRAGGLREMAWHLFRWGDGVEVVEPEALKMEYGTLLSKASKGLRR